MVANAISTQRSMKPTNFLPAALASLVFSASICLYAQHPRTAALTETETEQVAEAAVFPNERVKLYEKFLNERADKIKDMTHRPKSAQRVLKLDDSLQDFTALMDEM